VHGPIRHLNGDVATYLDLTFACTWISGDAHVADEESRAVAWVHRDRLAGHGVGVEMLRRIDAAFSDELPARFDV
jgi:hypothetical protein